MLKQGIIIWNQWRKDNPNLIPDLSGANLRGINLQVLHERDEWVDLSRVNLRNADLSQAMLEAADFSEADLQGAKFQFSILDYAVFENANLKRVNLFEASLYSACFVNADLTGANLDGTNILCAELAGAKVPRDVVNFELIDSNTQVQPSRNSKKESEEVNNQGLQYSPNYKVFVWKRLRFRSKTEIKIAEALDRAGVLYFPNCVARLNTSNGRRNLEADFLICYEGKLGILEVDGIYHTPTRRVEEQERERFFRHHQVLIVERFDAERCYSQPDNVVREFLELVAKVR